MPPPPPTEESNDGPALGIPSLEPAKVGVNDHQVGANITIIKAVIGQTRLFFNLIAIQGKTNNGIEMMIPAINKIQLKVG